MSPSFTVGEPVAYLKYERKTGDFNNEGVNVSVPIPVPAEGVTSQEFLKNVAETLENVKTIAFDALRIEYTFDAESGVIVPKPVAQLAAPPAPPRTPAPPAPPGGGGGDGDVNPQPDVLCGVCNGATFNNTTTPKQNPRFPDYKCKDRNCQAAMWLTGKDGGTWKKR